MEIDWTIAAIAAAWAVVLGGAGGALTEIGQWYHDLRKPSWQPPDWLFGPAWTLILGLAGWSFYRCWTAAPEALPVIGGLFALNFALHFAWSPLFFKMQRPDWALFENIFLWLSVLAMLVVLPSYDPLSRWLILPYLLWVSFAFVLNWKIVQLNRPFAGKAA